MHWTYNNIRNGILAEIDGIPSTLYNRNFVALVTIDVINLIRIIFTDLSAIVHISPESLDDLEIERNISIQKFGAHVLHSVLINTR